MPLGCAVAFAVLLVAAPASRGESAVVSLYWSAVLSVPLPVCAGVVAAGSSGSVVVPVVLCVAESAGVVLVVVLSVGYLSVEYVAAYGRCQSVVVRVRRLVVCQNVSAGAVAWLWSLRSSHYPSFHPLHCRCSGCWCARLFRCPFVVC